MHIDLCKLCNEHPAETVFRASAGGQEAVVLLCRSCEKKVREWAASFTRWQQIVKNSHNPDSHRPWLNFSDATFWENARTKQCRDCQMLFMEFVKGGTLGCPRCYDEFEEILEPILRRLHGVIQVSVSQEPSLPILRSSKFANQLAAEQLELGLPDKADVELELQLALLREDYEHAARLRDRLKEISSDN